MNLFSKSIAFASLTAGALCAAPGLTIQGTDFLYNGNVALNRNLEKIEEANKVYISNQGATLWQKKINLKNRNVAA